jgi:hypothetical protein
MLIECQRVHIPISGLHESWPGQSALDAVAGTLTDGKISCKERCYDFAADFFLLVHGCRVRHPRPGRVAIGRKLCRKDSPALVARIFVDEILLV